MDFSPTLDSEHSTQENSVRISLKSMESNMVTYTFSNWLYAKLFTEANSDKKIIETNKRNQTKSNSLLLSISHPVVNGLLVLAIVLAAVVLLLINF